MPLRRREMGHRVNWTARGEATTSQKNWANRVRVYWPPITRPRSVEQVEVGVGIWVEVMVSHTDPWLSQGAWRSASCFMDFC